MRRCLCCLPPDGQASAVSRSETGMARDAYNAHIFSGMGIASYQGGS